MLKTEPTSASSHQLSSDQSQQNMRDLPDSLLYRMVYIEPDKYSPAERLAAKSEMDNRAVGGRVVPKREPYQRINDGKKSHRREQSKLFDPNRMAPLFAILGLGYIASTLIHHWFNHQKITGSDISQGIFRLCISAAFYFYLVFRVKTTKRR